MIFQKWFPTIISITENLLNKEGPTSIRLIINNDSKKIFYNLENPRKFDFNHLKTLKSKEYVKKITI